MAIFTGGGGTALNNPYDKPQAWDTLTIAGQVLPGIVYDYGGFDVENGWQIKKGKGSIGGTLTYTQKPPAEGHFIMQLGSARDFVRMGPIRPLFLYNPSVHADKQAVTMQFPPTDDLLINSVLVKKIGPVLSVRGSGGRKYLYRIDLIQFLPTPPSVSVVSTATFTNANNPATAPIGAASLPTAPQNLKAIASQLLAQMQSSP
jgi:hypothetical protein